MSVLFSYLLFPSRQYVAHTVPLNWVQHKAGKICALGLSHLQAIVVIQPKVGNLFFSHKIAEGIFQFNQLNEEIMFGI
jgi:hypothetical protein